MRLRPTPLLACALGAALWWAPAAQAHPFGEPQSAAVTATADGLRVVWSASPDDLAVLARWLGVHDGSLVVVEDGELVAGESTLTPGIELARAEHLPAYLLERITVTADGAPCPGDVQPVADVEATGVAIDFDCGGAVPTAEVAIATLTDVDEDYRTLASGPDGQAHAYAADTGALPWTLGGTGPTEAPADDRARSATLQLGGIGLAAAVAAAAALLAARRRRTRRGL